MGIYWVYCQVLTKCSKSIMFRSEDENEDRKLMQIYAGNI